jgi:hypothetical protein
MDEDETRNALKNAHAHAEIIKAPVSRTYIRDSGKFYPIVHNYMRYELSDDFINGFFSAE